MPFIGLYRMSDSAENWQVFERNLKDFIITQDAIEAEESRYGIKYIVEGPLSGPSDKTMRIVSVTLGERDLRKIDSHDLLSTRRLAE